MNDLQLLAEEFMARMTDIANEYESYSLEVGIGYPSAEEPRCLFDNTDWLTLNDEYHMIMTRIFALKSKIQERKIVLKIKENVKDARKADTGLYLVTLSPPVENQNASFISAVHQFMKLKVIKSADYVFEQRGTVEGDYSGIHCHMLVERNCKPSQFWKEHKRVLSKFFGADTFRTPVWKVDNVENAEKPKVIRYMKGEKKPKVGKNKGEKAKNDANFRKAFSLLDMYTISPNAHD